MKSFNSIAIKLIFCLLLTILSFYTVYGRDESRSFIHFTNEGGLPSSYVKSITQDQYGFIWLATRISVSRFDGTNYKEFPAYDSRGELTDIYCNQIFMFADTLLITRTNDNVYYYFDYVTESFYPYKLLNDLGVVQKIVHSEKGFWVCQSNRIYFIDAATSKKTDYAEICSTFRIPANNSISDIVYRNNQLVAIANRKQLLKFNLQQQTLTSLDIETNLNNSTIYLNYIDLSGWVWAEDESNGLARINVETAEVIHFSTSENAPYKLPHNLVHSFDTDKQNRIWIGTESGLLIYDPLENKSEIQKFEMSNSKGLNTDPIYYVFCDKDGNMWLGTYFGGINFWRAQKSFFNIWEAGVGKWQLGGNVVSCLIGDQSGNLWIGLEDLGLNYLNKKTGEVTKFTSGKGKYGLSYDNVHDLLLVDENELWIATYTGGINVLNISTGVFRYYNRENTPELNSNAIYKFQKVDNLIYIATSVGINIFNLQTGKFSKFKPDIVGSLQFQSITKTNSTIWFSSGAGVYYYDIKQEKFHRFDRIDEFRNINFVKADSRNNIWIGDCYKGLACYNIAKDSMTYFDQKNNFHASWIFSIEESDDGWYWASSDKGLIKFHPRLGLNILYDSNSGIPFNQFNYRASFVDNEKNIYFGGNNGMVSFNEMVNPMLLEPTHVVLTGFQLFNKPVSPGGDSPLNESITKTDKIELKYRENAFTIEYSALTYSLQGRCQYAYYLEGFDEDWNIVGNRNFATYTNLSPGRYYFHVKGSTNNILNETNQRVIEIRVLPPFWLSNWAFLFYFVAMWFFSMFLYRFGKYLEKNRSLAEMERREKEHAEEIHNVKLEFFTNISHELKTPLTLILGPLNKIIKEEKLSPGSQKRLFGVEKNARRLYILINQLLDFRKIERGKEKLEITENNVNSFGNDISKAFESIIEVKDIEFVTNFPTENKTAWFDAQKVDKIIFNLLSNAFKFTPPGGKIEFNLLLEKKNPKMRHSAYNLVIEIADTGKGIKPDMIEKVFERFIQADNDNPEIHSSGIGLAFVKSLVLLHCGKIDVESECGKGTIFRVIIPASKKDYATNDLCSKEVQLISRNDTGLLLEQNKKSAKIIDTFNSLNKPTILLVEDNIEMTNYIKDILDDNYNVSQAYDGAEALQKIDKLQVDLIISDVMMPEMDGYALARQLKDNIETSHIPIILLTAKSGVENKIKGLDSGADVYVEKPFLPEVLIKNIDNIISTRNRLIERFKNDAFVQMNDMAFSESDKIFIEKITNIIKANISSDFDVNFLVSELGLSRTLIHMKLKSLLNCSTTEFIRSIRVKEAIKLISEGKCNISEAAYEVGFSSPTYFTRRFKELYGKSPREYFNLKKG